MKSAFFSLLAGLLLAAAGTFCGNTAFIPNENYKAAEKPKAPPTEGSMILKMTNTGFPNAHYSIAVYSSSGKLSGVIWTDHITDGANAINASLQSLDANYCQLSSTKSLANGTYTYYLSVDSTSFPGNYVPYTACPSVTEGLMNDGEQGATGTVTVNGDTVLTVASIAANVTSMTITAALSTGQSADKVVCYMADRNTTLTGANLGNFMAKVSGNLNNTTSNPSQVVLTAPKVPEGTYGVYCFRDPNNNGYEAGEDQGATANVLVQNGGNTGVTINTN